MHFLNADDLGRCHHKNGQQKFWEKQKRTWNFLSLLFLVINRCHHKNEQQDSKKKQTRTVLINIYYPPQSKNSIPLEVNFFSIFERKKNLKMTKSYPYCEGNFLNPLILKFFNWSLFYTSSFTLHFFHYSLHILLGILLLFSTSKN